MKKTKSEGASKKSWELLFIGILVAFGTLYWVKNSVSVISPEISKCPQPYEEYRYAGVSLPYKRAIKMFPQYSKQEYEEKDGITVFKIKNTEAESHNKKVEQCRIANGEF